jgi:hypothetical protein
MYNIGLNLSLVWMHFYRLHSGRLHTCPHILDEGVSDGIYKRTNLLLYGINDCILLSIVHTFSIKLWRNIVCALYLEGSLERA